MQIALLVLWVVSKFSQKLKHEQVTSMTPAGRGALQNPNWCEHRGEIAIFQKRHFQISY